MELLKCQEAQIFGNILKHSTTSNDQHQMSFDLKQSQFKSTCYAIESIIKNKLYKFTAQNLEQYFLKEFNVSRAQVYRLLDCAAVLRSLEGISPIPHKYKICKDLKQKAGLGPECRELWEKVLEHAKQCAIACSHGEPDSSPIRESDIESFAFDALPNIAKQKKGVINMNYLYSSDKENSNPNDSSPSNLNDSSPPKTHKRKMSESSIVSSLSHSPYSLSRATSRKLSFDSFSRKSSFDSFSRRPSIETSLPPSNSPYMPRKKSDSMKTLVDGAPHMLRHHKSDSYPLRRQSIDDLQARHFLPPILPKLRLSEADSRRTTNNGLAPLFFHKEEGRGREPAGKAYTIHESRFDGKPPPPIFKKRVSLPGLSSINNSSRANSSAISSPAHPSSNTMNYSFAASYSAPSDPIYQYAKNEMTMRHKSDQKREWEVYSHHLSSYQTAKASQGLKIEDDGVSYSQIHPPSPLKSPQGNEPSYESHAITDEFQKCQRALTRLSQRGYQLTPMVNGKWFLDHPIIRWRIVPSSQIENKDVNSLISPLKDSPGENQSDELKHVYEIGLGAEDQSEKVVGAGNVKRRRLSVLFDDLVAAAAHESSPPYQLPSVSA